MDSKRAWKPYTFPVLRVSRPHSASGFKCDQMSVGILFDPGHLRAMKIEELNDWNPAHHPGVNLLLLLKESNIVRTSHPSRPFWRMKQHLFRQILLEVVGYAVHIHPSNIDDPSAP